MKANVAAQRHYAGALQSALTLDEVNDAFMNVVAAIIPASGCGLYQLDADGRGVVDVRASVAADFLGDYEEYGRRDDPVLDFAMRERKPIDSSRVVAPSQWETCGARSVLALAGYCHSLEAPVIVSGAVFGTINFARTSEEGPFNKAELGAARFASEQLGLATERALRFERTGHRVSMLESTLDRVSEPVIVTDLTAQTLYTNRAARNLPLTPDGQSSDRLRQVHESIVEAMEHFRVGGKRVHTTNVASADTAERLIVKSFRLPDSHDSAVTLVFEAGKRQGKHLPMWSVLSRREQEIAELVAQGWTNKQIAERAFISEHTVRQHLKRMFIKTGAHNRAELVQMVWASGSTAMDADGTRS